MPKTNTHFARVGAVMLILAGVAIASYAQQTQSSQPTPDSDQSGEPLKVNVNVVQLFFNVKDKKGGLIPNLTKDQFQVSEDGKPQTIKYFAAESDLPLTLGILFDTSPSQTQVLDMEKVVGGQFLDQILRPKDLAFVMGFDADVDLLQDFTNSTHLLKKAMNGARIGGGGGMTGPGGGPVPTMSHGCCTMLYDAVYLAAHDELAQQVGRKAMILLTDGEDEGSKLKIQDAIEAAQKSDAICYVLLIADRGGMWGGFGSGEMNKLTKETGGRVIEVGNKFEKLKEGFDQIARELRSQYNLGYTPTNGKLDGTFRKIEIHANSKDYKIQSRAGYYAVPKAE
ncbi:MAG: VWA domain-containing protein [Terriglobales bacterium]